MFLIIINKFKKNDLEFHKFVPLLINNLSFRTLIYTIEKFKQQNVIKNDEFTFNNVNGISALLEILTSFNGLLLNSDSSNITSVFSAFNPANQDITFTNFLQVEALGHGLYTYGAVLLIISSIILLLAMVAPIFLSRSNK